MRDKGVSETSAGSRIAALFPAHVAVPEELTLAWRRTNSWGLLMLAADAGESKRATMVPRVTACCRAIDAALSAMSTALSISLPVVTDTIAGIVRERRMTMIATTMTNSISVKPLRG